MATPVRTVKKTAVKAPKTFSMMDVDELKTTQGTSFLIYNSSASRKTRTLGSMGDGSLSMHISLDGGSNSATDAMRTLGIENAKHYVTTPKSLVDLGDTLIALQTNKDYIDKVDTIIIDNLVIFSEWLKSYISASKKYESDALHVEDVNTNNTDKEGKGSKVLPFFSDLQRLLREWINLQLLPLLADYNIIVLAGETESVASNGAPLTTVLAAGPKSISPLVSVFSECYRTDFEEGDFDSKDHTATFFKISTYSDPLTGMNYFAKTRNIKNLDSLKANKIPADFHKILTEEIGYVYKSLR